MIKLIPLSLTVLILFEFCGNKTGKDNQQEQKKNPDSSRSKNVVWHINKPHCELAIEVLDSLQYYAIKANAHYKPRQIEKISDFPTVKRMLKGIAEFRETEHAIGIRRILFRKGGIYTSKNDEEMFVAYYPHEDILLFEGGHSSDVSFDLKNGRETEETGNPEYIVASPNDKFRLNGFFDGQECVSYFLQKNINGTFENVISLNEAFVQNDRINLCQLKDAFWADDHTLLLSEALYADGDVATTPKYYKVSIVKAEKDIKKEEVVFQSAHIEDFVPQGYVVYKEEDAEDIKGDLNKDGLEDRVLIIKKTGKEGYAKNQFGKKVDKNRRGIIILFNRGKYYELALKNYDCFSSENEDGGVYFPPDMWVGIEKGNLFVHYAHGRYGYWRYTFRYQNRDFELIGYDASSNRGPVPQYETSINFLTRKKLTRDNLNKDVYGDDYVDDNFVDTWEDIKSKELIRLSEIRNFDDLDFE